MLQATNHLKYVMLFILSVYLSISISEVDAATIQAASCSRYDVGIAISSSTYGDKVIVPAGNCLWSSTLTISKGITLQGAGAGSTVITSNVGGSNWLILYYADTTTLTTEVPITITGFTFDMNNSSAGLFVGHAEPMLAIRNLQLHNNEFKNTVSSARCLRTGFKGTMFGVIYNNTFTNCNVAGDSYGYNRNSWDNFGADYGSMDNLYWEDNTITLPPGGTAHFGGGGGRYVTRFNTYTISSGNYAQLWDMHGNQGAVNNHAHMVTEIYRNAVTVNANFNGVAHRGGKALVFQNTLTGTHNGDWVVKEEVADSENKVNDNPVPQHPSDAYYFENRSNGTLRRAVEATDCCAAIAEDSEFYNQDESFNGTIGVGVGLLSARPTTCTTGVGYWATDQGSWNTQGEDGVLYKCTATNTWTLYYEPLTYPHPLRSGAGDTLAPAAPTILSVL